MRNRKTYTLRWVECPYCRHRQRIAMPTIGWYTCAANHQHRMTRDQYQFVDGPWPQPRIAV